ncbi:MAG: type IV toxin-antitoxin system AbiEi family antitoxin domain-containing protein [Phycisphaerae bacterium]|nr:type IV toxin-antitoxin system AbiEi family antitoxin domain-containing protein [Phycisphaerae bacterium]NUQ44706.1 type IV toxin-antitoxin system AbiEi family antitoxin domain-containing protein [Phycisphaerae bacterium]
MADPSTTSDKVVRLARRKGILRVRDLIEHGIHPEYLRRLCAAGILQRSGRGLYLLADADYSANITLVQAAHRVPHGVICLLSALRYHEIGTQLPHEVWMMIAKRAALPKVDYPRMRFCRASGMAFHSGIERHRIDRTDIAIYGVAKTIADCLKYRNKIGLDVTLEALRDCLRKKRAPIDEIWMYAKTCRVDRIMRPYLEALA